MNLNMQKIEKGLKSIDRRLVYWLFVAFLCGAFAAFWARFTLVEKTETHYHANFAVFINGEREKFESFTYYEEVSACTGDHFNQPSTRTHMHDQVSHVVHVHDKAVTWGNFFENLGMTLGNRVLDASGRTLVDGSSGQLRFILNGKTVESIANEVIKSEDVLLIDFGSDSENVLEERFSEITADADEYNKRQDPSSCQGGKSESFSERLKRTIGIES